ncbi:MAG TPA: PilN domain-containing protein [Gemmatimonadales bacterium]|nr:PilN domain-containing protein [Gemmatimonadales bacterium]
MITVNLRPGTRRGGASRGAAFAGLGEKLKGAFSGAGSGTRDPMKTAAIAALAAVVLGAGFMFFRTGSQLGELEPQIEEAMAEKARYRAFIREKTHELRVRDSILSQIGTISAVDRARYAWPHILDEVAYALPDNTWLTEVTQLATNIANDPGASVVPVIRVQGITGDLANYTAFLRRLEASPWLVNVLPLQAQSVIQGNRPLTQFTIQATFSQADSSVIRSQPIIESVVED